MRSTAMAERKAWTRPQHPRAAKFSSDSSGSSRGSRSSSTTLSTRLVNRSLYQYSPPSRDGSRSTRPISLVDRSRTVSPDLKRGAGVMDGRLDGGAWHQGETRDRTSGHTMVRVQRLDHHFPLKLRRRQENDEDRGWK